MQPRKNPAGARGANASLKRLPQRALWDAKASVTPILLPAPAGFFSACIRMNAPRFPIGPARRQERSSACRRSIQDTAMFTPYRERRARRAFGCAQAAWDSAEDPLWNSPDPDPDELAEPENDDDLPTDLLGADLGIYPGR
jgi:hypothetical protein